MKNTISTLLFFTLITGVLFTACVKQEDVVEVPVVEEGVEVNMEIGGGNEEVLEDDSEDDVVVSVTYDNGNYTAVGAYQSPAMVEKIEVNLTLEDDVIASLDVVSLATNETSIIVQGKFVEGINAEVVGKKLEEVNITGPVNGSSLSPEGFNEALDIIKAQAAK